MSEFLKKVSLGFGFLFSGVRLTLADPVLMLWALTPFLINLGIVVFVLSRGFGWVEAWTNQAVSYLISPEAGYWFLLFYYPLFVLLFISFAIAVIYGSFLVASLICSPFNSMLAERHLVKRGVVPDRPFEWSRWIRITIKMFLASLLKAAVFLALGLIIFVSSFVPGLNLASSFFAFLIMSFDSFDYSFEILEMDLGQRFSEFRQLSAESVGMAGAFSLTVFIPGLPILMLPFAVVGAAEVLSRQSRYQLNRGSIN